MRIRYRTTDMRFKRNKILARRQRILVIKANIAAFLLGCFITGIATSVLGKPNGVSAKESPVVETTVVVQQVQAEEPKTMQEYIDLQKKSGIKQTNLDYLEAVVLPTTRIYGIPDALAAGQWAAEGRYINPRTNNFWNLMYKGTVHSYASLEKAASDYDLTLRNLVSGSLGIDRTKFSYSDYTEEEMLNALQTGKYRFEGHSSDPMEYVRLVSSTPEFRYFKGKK